VPRAEFGRAGPRARLDECSYFSEFFLAQHTFVPEIFVGGKHGFPIAMTTMPSMTAMTTMPRITKLASGTDPAGKTDPVIRPESTCASKITDRITGDITGNAGAAARLRPQPAAGSDDRGDPGGHHRQEHDDRARQRRRKSHLAAPPNSRDHANPAARTNLRSMAGRGRPGPAKIPPRFRSFRSRFGRCHRVGPGGGWRAAVGKIGGRRDSRDFSGRAENE
jgi:hypothetical protein